MRLRLFRPARCGVGLVHDRPELISAGEDLLRHVGRNKEPFVRHAAPVVLVDEHEPGRGRGETGRPGNKRRVGHVVDMLVFCVDAGLYLDEGKAAGFADEDVRFCPEVPGKERGLEDGAGRRVCEELAGCCRRGTGAGPAGIRPAGEQAAGNCMDLLPLFHPEHLGRRKFGTDHAVPEPPPQGFAKDRVEKDCLVDRRHGITEMNR